MHEIGLMQDALDIALRQAAGQNAQRVERVSFRIGAVSGVVPEVIEMAFTVATRGTLAEGAELTIEHVPLVCFCRGCGQEFAPDADALARDCPRCGQPAAEVRRGHEFELVSLDIT
jgi:hydrogenase nickel incorporation protein HypA/HybF